MDFQELMHRINQAHSKFPRKYDKKTQVVNLMEEVGELANAVLVEAGDKPEKCRRADLRDSLADVLFALVVTANECGVDLETVIVKTLSEIEERQKAGDYEDE